MASSYRARYTSDWAVIVIIEWLMDFLEDVVVRSSFNEFPFLEEVDPSSGRPLKL
jgi:hypothetical protein